VSRPPLPTLARTLWYWRGEQWLAAAESRLRLSERRLRRAERTPYLVASKSAVPWLPPPRRAQRVPGRAPASAKERRHFAWSDLGAGRVAFDELHACAWLRSDALGADERLLVMLDWIAANPKGPGWEPALCARRVLAWLKCLTTPGALPAATTSHGRVLPALADQLATLDAHLETHRLARRKLVNLFALASAATLLEGGEAERWGRVLPLCAAELERQIGRDGAHEAKSPLLHAELLEGVLDLLNALRSAPGRAGGELEARLAEQAGAMLAAHAVWTHPDGEIALLGDSALGAAPPLAALAAYARALGVAARTPARPHVLDAAGVVRLERGPFVAIFTAAPPAPAFAPVHAHCDALSFELSAFGERVVVDTGVADFAEGPRRDTARATRSHATVEVNDAEQAELWGADRVGGRPDVGLVRVEPGASVEGVCAGWSTPEVLHRRTLRLEDAGLRIEDRFDLPAARARLVLPLAPGVSARLEGARAALRLPSGRRLEVALPENARWRSERGPCFVALGAEHERTLLVGTATRLAAADWAIIAAH
jgi:uncharacterized heparinase superfamily protein